MIPLHAERGDTPNETRWMCPEGTFAEVGAISSFGIDAGLTPHVASARVESSRCVSIRLQDGVEWRDLGSDAWSQVSELVEARGSWQLVSAARGVSADERLAQAVRTVLDGTFGDFVASHGGHVTLLDVRDGVVSVALTGACAHCPAAEWTLRMRLERDLRVTAGSDFQSLVAR